MSTNEELLAELAELRAKVDRMEAALTAAPAARPERQVLSRRNLLRAAPIAAVGAGIAALSATPAAAATGSPVLLGESNDAGAAATTTVTGGTNYQAGGDNADYYVAGIPIGSAPALAVTGGMVGDWLATNDMTVGQQSYACVTIRPSEALPGLYVKGGDNSGEQPHVNREASAAIFENIGPGAGLKIHSTDGVLGGAIGEFPYPADGVVVSTNLGVAFTGSSQGQVVKATSTNTTGTIDAVSVSYAGKSRAFYAESTNTTNVNGTITGVNDGAGIGVWGENKNTTAAGIGVVGVGNKAGRGGRFAGGVANLQLTPGTSSTHPTTGKAGDLFVDSAARLWYCQKSSNGSTAATWKQLA